MRWILLNPDNTVKSITNQPDNSINYDVVFDDNTECRLGWIFTGADFIAPSWTAYQFLLRLTPEERADIRQRAKTDPNVADFLMLCQSAQEVVSNDPITVMGMNYMVAIGVFTEQRKKEILQILE
jgi:hypothetical protein